MNNNKKKFYNLMGLVSPSKNNRRTSKGRKRQYIYDCATGRLLKTLMHTK